MKRNTTHRVCLFFLQEALILYYVIWMHAVVWHSLKTSLSFLLDRDSLSNSGTLGKSQEWVSRNITTTTSPDTPHQATQGVAFILFKVLDTFTEEALFHTLKGIGASDCCCNLQLAVCKSHTQMRSHTHDQAMQAWLLQSTLRSIQTHSFQLPTIAHESVHAFATFPLH